MDSRASSKRRDRFEISSNAPENAPVTCWAIDQSGGHRRIKGSTAADLQSATAALARCRQTATHRTLKFTPTDDALKALGVLSQRLLDGPIDFAGYRSARFGTARATELDRQGAIEPSGPENEQARFDGSYLDALPRC